MSWRGSASFLIFKRVFVAAAVFIAATSSLLFAEGTRTWEQSKYEEFVKGTPHGVAISSGGYLELAPEFKLLASTPSSAVWATAVGPDGQVYAATGAPARVYRVAAGAPPVAIFQPQELQDKKARTDRRSVAFGPFQADLDGRLVTGANGAVVDMAKSEFDVLEVFLTRANRLLTRAAISEAIGFTEDPESSRAVDIRIMRLRKKIETDPANPKFLRTVRGEGYIFSLPAGDGS